MVGAGLAASVLAATLVLPPVLHSFVRPVVGHPEAGDLSAIADQAAWADDPVPPGLDLAGALNDVPGRRVAVHADDLECAYASQAAASGSCWWATARRPCS